MRRPPRVAVLFAAAVVVRAACLWMYVAQHPARALSVIPFLFEPGNIAYSLATGHGFSSPFRVETGPTAWMTPVYPLLLAGIFRLFGTYTLTAFVAAAGFNALCSAATTIPLYYAARRVGGTRTAIVAALLWVIFPNAVLLPYESLFEGSLSALLLAWIFLSTLRVAEAARRRDWALYGFLWGAGLMTNAALLVLLPFLVGWAGLRTRGELPALAALVIMACCAPWTIRNYVEFHALVPLRSVTGLALWLGNNERARSDSVAGLHPISNQAERDRYVEMGEIAYTGEKLRLALGYMAEHPVATAVLSAERFEGFWTGGSTNLVKDFSRARSARFYYVVLFNLLAGVGSLAGIVALWRARSPFLAPLAVFPLVFPLVYYLALGQPRYRHPVDPEILLLAALAIAHLSKYRKRPLSGPPALSP